MLTAVLNTKSYLGGAPFDTDGDDTYQLTGWVDDAVLTELHFIVDEGDVTKIKMEILDQPHEGSAKVLFKDELTRVAHRTYSGIPIKGSKHGRLHVRLTALDGSKPNHCKAVFYGGDAE